MTPPFLRPWVPGTAWKFAIGDYQPKGDRFAEPLCGFRSQSRSRIDARMDGNTSDPEISRVEDHQ